ncbi:DUF3619 family protein [Thiohalobacter sp.]|uniref:DUF3619 family protein n=1 Tax=Thiohalobacter sp. TaxID=2025948 RepID=UPI00261D1156|nr:DUF3619 family protein [Thiohalobacter sp.]
MTGNTDEFERRVRALLDADADALDPATRERLAAARQRALAQAREGGGSRRGWVWGLAASLVLGIALILTLRQGEPAAPALEDLAVLSADEAPEFYEDLDFYTWLAEQAQAEQG